LTDADWDEGSTVHVVPRGGAGRPRPTPSPSGRGSLDPGEVVGGYRVRRFIDRGSAGEVYQAETPDGAPIALKLLRPMAVMSDGTSAPRFAREGDMLRRLEHPNIVRLVDRGRDGERTFMALELVDGRDLAALMKELPERHLSLGEALFVLDKCARGLAAAHEAGIIHRDIKPANVLVTRGGQVKLTDFGIALAADASSRLTANDEVLGTPHYIAPEVLLRSEWSAASDMYALGVLIHRLITGAPPFRRTSVREIIQAHVREEPPRLADLAPAVPLALSRLVDRLLAKAPDDRPSAIELIDALYKGGLRRRSRTISRLWSRERVAAAAAAERAAGAEPTVAAELIAPGPPAVSADLGGAEPAARPAPTAAPRRAAPAAPRLAGGVRALAVLAALAVLSAAASLVWAAVRSG